MVLSRYICALTVWNPIAGPPARISTLTPVSAPPAINVPVTFFFPASIFGFGPTSWYSAPCSASGFQSVWITTVLGQTSFRLAPAAALPDAEPAGAAASLDVAEPPLELEPQAVTDSSEIAAPTPTTRVRVGVRMQISFGWGRWSRDAAAVTLRADRASAALGVVPPPD